MAAPRDPLQVLVFDDDHHRVGVVVGEIIDVVEEEAVAAQLSSRRYFIGSALAGKNAAAFLDLQAVCATARTVWYDAKSAAEIKPAAIVLIDQSAFTRGLVRSYLETAGHQVFEASNGAEALEKFEYCRVQLAIVSANLPGNGAVFEQIRRRTRDVCIPLIGLLDERGAIAPEMARKYDACHFKSDRQAIIGAVERLIGSRAHGNGIAEALSSAAHEA